MNCPWSNINDKLSKKEILNTEIIDFQTYIAPTEKEKRGRDKLLLAIEELIKEEYPSAKLECFGSVATGLLLPGSDIDVTINLKKPAASNVEVLRKLNRQICRKRLFYYSELSFVPWAKVPVLTINSQQYITSIDITVNNPSPSSDRTINWKKDYPELTPLYLVLKHALLSIIYPLDGFQVMSSKLNGLASFSLVCLIMHYILYQKKDDLTPSSSTYYADLLLGFLDFYSNFDYNRKGFQFDKDEPYISKKSTPKLLINDPDLPKINVGRSTSMIEETKECFAFLLERLLKNINDTSANDQKSVLSAIIKVEKKSNQKSRLEGRDYEIYPLIISKDRPMEEIQNHKRKRSREDENENRNDKYNKKQKGNNYGNRMESNGNYNKKSKNYKSRDGDNHKYKQKDDDKYKRKDSHHFHYGNDYNKKRKRVNKSKKQHFHFD
ncbi:hypothetical protein BJ944DRAFT_260758 [Cunninghamella echinulata]|nr:hypothetical protein BJ944DRAFT_260758 [Cunninghamella echinulata]